MRWYERLLESTFLRFMAAFLLACLWSLVLLQQYSLALDSVIILISVLIIYNLRDYLKDMHCGESSEHDFAGWLVLNTAAMALLAAVINALFKLNVL